MSTATEQVEYPEQIDAAVLKIAGVVVLGAIMAILDITVVNVALPTFQADLDVTNYSTVAWTVTAYEERAGAVLVTLQASYVGRSATQASTPPPARPRALPATPMAVLSTSTRRRRSRAARPSTPSKASVGVRCATDSDTTE